MQPRIAIVIPCKNEQATVQRTLESLIAQTLPPEKIILVDDGSTDDTGDIVRRIADREPHLDYICLTQRRSDRNTGYGIAEVVRRGLAEIKFSNYDFIAKFDADLEFPPNYLREAVQVFHDNEDAGLVGGVCTIYKSGGWEIERVAKSDHVRGALKLYRSFALEAIGGLAPITGWDTLDEHKLRYLGYDVIVRQDLRVKQFRATNQATDKIRMARKLGETLYNLRASPLVLIVSLLKRGLRGDGYSLRYLTAGYLAAKRNGAELYLSRKEAKFANSYRRRGFIDSALKLITRDGYG